MSAPFIFNLPIEISGNSLWNATSIHKGKGLASFSCPSRSADTVYVAFKILWNLIVDHMGHVRNVQTPGGYIGGYQYLNIAPFELIKRFFSGILRFVAMDEIGFDSGIV
jgi:hypothetical protein